MRFKTSNSMQVPESILKCTDCGERFRSNTFLQQHIHQTGHMASRVAQVPDEYRVLGDESSFYCKRCHKSFTSVPSVLQHEAAKHSAPKKTFYRRCGNCNMEQTTAFGWLNHRGDCKKVPIDIRNRIKLAGLKCIVSPETCTLCCAGIGMILHLKDEHGIDLDYFEDDFAEKFQEEGLVRILADEETRRLPQFEGLQQQFELSAQWNGERLKRLNEARLRVIQSEGEDLAARRAREFREYIDWLTKEQCQKENERRIKILRQKEDACAEALEAEKRLTAERKQKAAAVFAEVRATFEKMSALVKSNQTDAANDEIHQMVLKLQMQRKNTQDVIRKESAEYASRTDAEVTQLQEQLARLKELKNTVARIVERVKVFRATSDKVTDFQTIDRHNIAPQLLEPLAKYSNAVVFDQGKEVDKMSTSDILRQEEKIYGQTRKPEKIWVPSYSWVEKCQIFKKENAAFRPVLQALDDCFASKSSACGFAFNGPPPKNGKSDYDPEAFETWYLFQGTFNATCFFIKRLLGDEPFAKRFMTDPVLFFQALCLFACNTERFGTEVVNELARLLLAEHTDFGDSAGLADLKGDNAADAGDKASSAEQKPGNKKGNGNVQNNLVKYACCIPKHLRHTLHEVLSNFTQKLFAARRGDMQDGQEFDYSSKFGDQYTIAFGSVFYLDIMEARSLLKCEIPKIADYARACFKIGFEINAAQSRKIFFEVPWKDVVLSVHASESLCSDVKPSQHEWSVLLRELQLEFPKRFEKNPFCEKQLAALLSDDVSVCSERWSLLDNAYESQSKGFFDFERQSKVVFQNVLQGFLSQPAVFHNQSHFEDWWKQVLAYRGQQKTGLKIDHRRNKAGMQRLAPANESGAFWEASCTALWLLDFISYSREIMQHDYDQVQDFEVAGVKRSLESVDVPRTFRQLFHFISEQMLSCEAFDTKELLGVNLMTPDAKVFHKFSEWLEDHNKRQKAH